MQCHSRSWRQQCTRKNPVKSCLNTLGKKLHRKNLLQRCLNTPWTTLHRLNKSLCNFVLEAPENRLKLYAMLSERLQTTYHRKKFCAMLHQYSWDNTTQEKPARLSERLQTTLYRKKSCVMSSEHHLVTFWQFLFWSS